MIARPKRFRPLTALAVSLGLAETSAAYMALARPAHAQAAQRPAAAAGPLDPVIAAFRVGDRMAKPPRPIRNGGATIGRAEPAAVLAAAITQTTRESGQPATRATQSAARGGAERRKIKIVIRTRSRSALHCE